jgi:hypothetical protein
LRHHERRYHWQLPAGIVALLRTGAENGGAKQIRKTGGVHPQVHPLLRHALGREIYCADPTRGALASWRSPR